MDKLSAFQIEFISNCCYRLDESLRMIKISLDTISEEQVWQKPNDSLNTIGNLILHLCGNMTQYGIASLNETVDERQRDVEFSTKGGFTKKELLKKLETTVNEVKKTLQNTSAERLVSLKKVQGFEFSGIGNSIHLVEHFSYHTGQIAFWVKLLNNKPLGFYDGLDLTVLNDD